MNFCKCGNGIGNNLKGESLSISSGLRKRVFNTIGLESPIISFRVSRKPFSKHKDGLRLKSFATQIAAVLRTYGLSS